MKVSRIIDRDPQPRFENQQKANLQRAIRTMAQKVIDYRLYSLDLVSEWIQW